MIRSRRATPDILSAGKANMTTVLDDGRGQMRRITLLRKRNGRSVNRMDNDIVEQTAAKQAALSLVEQGIATMAEAARLAGLSRQMMRYWARDVSGAGSKAPRAWSGARSKYLRRQWKEALKQAKETKSDGVS
jgi:hypothetical protein